MKPFDIEAAKRGEKVITRDGREVRIICFDRVNKIYPIIGLVRHKDKSEGVYSFDINGSQFGNGFSKELDLFMAPKKKTLWYCLAKSETGRIFTSSLYSSEEYMSELLAHCEILATHSIEIEE